MNARDPRAKRTITIDVTLQELNWLLEGTPDPCMNGSTLRTRLYDAWDRAVPHQGPTRGWKKAPAAEVLG